MKINRYVNGEYRENCYLLYEGSFALIIDPGSRISKMDNFINDNNLKVVGILITHSHADHTGALKFYTDKYSSKVINYKDNKNQKIESFEFEIIKTFGHTIDSVSFYFEKESIMFTGDFLFKDTIGNYEKINERLMYKSLTKILHFDKSVKIFPGHDESSTLEYEFKNNPFLRGLKWLQVY